ncbi:6875_t:CDS:2, partial [Gigaspora rosea]
ECETGVNGQSILFELHSIDFPASFPVDIMHALFENVAQHMFRHFTSKFYNNEKLNDTGYKISTHNWNKIGKIMEHNRKTMPLEFGRPPINIQRYYNGFKAENWYNWTVLYSLPLFQNHLPAKYINGWAKFVRATQLCLEPTITNEELKEIKVLL